MAAATQVAHPGQLTLIRWLLRAHWIPRRIFADAFDILHRRPAQHQAVTQIARRLLISTCKASLSPSRYDQERRGV